MPGAEGLHAEERKPRCNPVDVPEGLDVHAEQVAAGPKGLEQVERHRAVHARHAGIYVELDHLTDPRAVAGRPRSGLGVRERGDGERGEEGEGSACGERGGHGVGVG